MPEQVYRRNRLRYPGYDYSQPGAIFVTIDTHNRQRLFGDVSKSQVVLSIPGQFVRDTWSRLVDRFPDITLDEFVVMPDHLHGIIMTGTNPSLDDPSNTVGFVINSFKNQVTAGWRNGVATMGWPRYGGKLWHRDYYERIIRNDIELEAIREYIRGNPWRWEDKRRE